MSGSGSLWLCGSQTHLPSTDLTLNWGQLAPTPNRRGSLPLYTSWGCDPQRPVRRAGPVCPAAPSVSSLRGGTQWVAYPNTSEGGEVCTNKRGRVQE